MRFCSASSSCSSRAGHHLEPEVQEVPEHLRADRAARAGRPPEFSVGTRHVRLTGKLVCSGVCLNRYAITIFSSASLFSSSSIRTSSVDTSFTSSSGGSLRLSDDVGDALDERRLVHRVRDAGDVDRLAGARRRAHLPGGAQADRAGAGLVDLLQLVGRVQDLAAGRKVGPLDVAAQLRAGQLRVVEQLDERRADLAEVVRRDVGRHADGDAGRAVDQQVRDARRQDDRLGLACRRSSAGTAPCPGRSR